VDDNNRGVSTKLQKETIKASSFFIFRDTKSSNHFFPEQTHMQHNYKYTQFTKM